jgi:hypothetical protein
VFPHWKNAIAPLLEAAAPRTVLEIGVAAGGTTRKLVTYASPRGAVVHGIDVAPTPAAEQLATQHPGRFVFHRGRSLEVLPRLEAVECVLIDGDHNWYTVLNELRLLARTAPEGRDLPLTFLHDVGWPYGRRDLYYEPDAIPAEQRQPLRRGGVIPGQTELVVDGGLNRTAWHAVAEGGPRNGVLTAVEDFLAESDAALRLELVVGFAGLGILVSERELMAKPALREALAVLESPAFLRDQCQRLEVARSTLCATRPRAARRGAKER